jgi:hypothetical protein
VQSPFQFGFDHSGRQADIRWRDFAGKLMKRLAIDAVNHEAQNGVHFPSNKGFIFNILWQLGI